MKKPLSILLAIAFVFIVGCGVTIWKLQPTDNTAYASDDTSSTHLSSNTQGSWNHVVTFIGASYTQTDPFYIKGDKFRVKYTATPASDIANNPDTKPFIVIQAKNQIQNDEFLYGHINDTLNMVISGILNVGQGNGFYHLLIWDIGYANWQIEVESFH